MEAIIMDKLFNTTKIVDVFMSFIWDEPYIGYGTFELEFPMDPFIMAGVEEGYYVSIKQSKRYMIIEKIDIKTDVKEGDTVILSGRSLESILTRRIIREDVFSEQSLDSFCQRMFNANSYNPNDIQRKINEIAYKKSTDPRVLQEQVSVEYKKGDYLYDALFESCRACYIGFRVIPDKEGSMYLELYSGTNRSYSQETVPWVVFSPKYENLNNSQMIIDYTEYKNVIIVEYSYTEQVFSGYEVDDKGNVVIDESTGKPKALYKETEYTEVLEVGDTNARGLNRRELFKHIDAELEPVDRTVYGTPQDRVNQFDYMEWGVTNFDKNAFDKDTVEWAEQAHARAPIRDVGSKTEKIWVRNPNLTDAQYNQMIKDGVSWLTGSWVKRPETDEEFKKRTDRFWSLIEGSAPKEADYYSFGWRFRPGAEELYYAEIRKAEEEIAAEYNAALATARERMMNAVRSEAFAELQPYLKLTSFSGDVDFNVNYHYGRDYFLGDIVQIVDKNGYQAETRIVSYLISQDSNNGTTFTPTFESDEEATVTI